MIFEGGALLDGGSLYYYSLYFESYMTSAQNKRTECQATASALVFLQSF